ncbi:MAG: metallophosphoesterase [Patescibacteria group bacterium]|nr:metallophosphoesterase [Patescibacteria group bacterium]
MKIGIISDSHNQLENFERAISYLHSVKAGLVIHCGDWTNPTTLEILKKLKIPLKGVLGNCDTEMEVYQYKLERELKSLIPDIELQDSFLETEIDDRKIVITHGDNESLLLKLIHSEKYDLVCCGHTHRAKIDKMENTLVVNPGSIAGFYNINPPVAITPTLGIYDTSKGIAEIIKF